MEAKRGHLSQQLRPGMLSEDCPSPLTRPGPCRLHVQQLKGQLTGQGGLTLPLPARGAREGPAKPARALPHHAIGQHRPVVLDPSQLLVHAVHFPGYDKFTGIMT